MKICQFHILLLFVVTYFGCTGMKNITNEDPLFIGNEFIITDGTNQAKNIIRQAASRLQPKPNQRLLWMRPALARNNMLSDSAKKKKFWKNKIDDPVVLSQVQPYLAGQILQNRIYHNGFFQNTVGFDTLRIGKKRAKYLYQITLNDPHKIGSVVFPEPRDELSEKIDLSQEHSLLKAGDLYSLETIIKERIRIDHFLKDRGYLYFNPEFIYLQADSISEDHMVNIRVLVKPETPPESRTQIGRAHV